MPRMHTILNHAPVNKLFPISVYPGYNKRQEEKEDRTLVPAARATTVAATAETMRFVLSTEPIVAICGGVFGTCNCSKMPSYGT